ncbi:MAG: aminoacyl-tRNA hydrolase [Candidatus Latescibacteria bacterium]|nr:aminoacyl-tRNA hydrolase [Candidatus Latescibacterota bacterium]
MIQITETIQIPESDLVFTASRSSGPGGQNVNKVNTRITVFFDANKSESLLPEQKQLILERLATRANKNGVIRVYSQRYRTQKANREAAITRLVELLRSALHTKPARINKSVPPAAKHKRLEDKKKRSLLKQSRKAIIDE